MMECCRINPFKKVISSVLLIFMLLTMVPGWADAAEADPMRLDVPGFRQVWEPWVYQNVGFSGMSFEMGGCAMTSLAMVLKYYGVDTDPERLNNWLKENNGFPYGGASISWSKAMDLGYGIYVDGIWNYDGNADLAFIRSQIDSGYPVIAKMGYKGTDHYVVLCGYSGNTFYINDPWYENPGHTMETVGVQGGIDVVYDDYQDPSLAIKGIVVIKTINPTPPKVPVRTIASMFTDWPTIMVHPLQTPVIQMKVDDPSMTVDGVKKLIDPSGTGASPKLITRNSTTRTLVPIRAIIEAMGGTVGWDGKAGKVTIQLQNRTLELWTGVKTAFNNKYYFEFDVTPQIIDGRTMIPVRYVAEQLGANVLWDGQTKTITIKAR